MESHYRSGGFEARFNVVRIDGRPIRPDARYLVLDYSGADRHAIEAVRAYIRSVKIENPGLATDLQDALISPQERPAQHSNKRNIYRKSFYAKCPENNQTILYRLKIEAFSTIMIEAIDAAVEKAIRCPKPYHENIADFLYAELGGFQTINAVHHGTNIESHRGF